MQRRKELFKAEVICDGFVEETGLRLKSFHLLQLSETEASQVIIPGSPFILSQPNEMILTKFPFCGLTFRIWGMRVCAPGLLGTPPVLPLVAYHRCLETICLGRPLTILCDSWLNTCFPGSLRTGNLSLSFIAYMQKNCHKRGSHYIFIERVNEGQYSWTPICRFET